MNRGSAGALRFPNTDPVARDDCGDCGCDCGDGGDGFGGEVDDVGSDRAINSDSPGPG